VADAYVETHEATWRNAKHRYQWRQTLTDYWGPIRLKPIDQIGTADVLAVLKPLWSRAPETASRLRGRIQTAIEAAQALGHIAEDKANPARWKGHLDHLLAPPKKLGVRGHHKAMPYDQLPEFVNRLRASDNWRRSPWNFSSSPRLEPARRSTRHGKSSISKPPCGRSHPAG
jgi:hypothetical protein